MISTSAFLQSTDFPETSVLKYKSLLLSVVKKPVGTGRRNGTISYINKLKPASSPASSLVLIFEMSFLLDIFEKQFREDYDLACRGENWERDEAKLFLSV